MPSKKTIQDIKVPERKPAPQSGVPSARPSVRSKKRSTTVEVSAPVRTRARKATPVRPRVRVLSATPSAVHMPSARAPRTPSSRRRYWWVVILLVLVIVSGWVYGTIAHSATIVIAPKETTVAETVSMITLAREPNQNEIPLVVMTLSDTIVDTVRSTGSAEVAERASGTITIYNNFSTAPQKFVEETRFEAANGKIYKTAKGSETIVPGKVGTTPGSVTVTVFAAEAGDTYNQAPTDFVIPGFKGTAKFDGFYARSTTPLAGGFIGSRATISPEDQARIVATLSQKLGDRLRAEAFLQKTDAFIILDESSRVAIDEPQIVASTENSIEAKITIPGTFTAVLVNKEELARRLATLRIPEYKGEPIAIQNTGALEFSIDTVGSLETAERLSVRVSGTPQFVYGIEEATLTKQLLSLSRKESQAVFERHSAIASARLVLRPFWKLRLPATENNIRIRYILDGK